MCKFAPFGFFVHGAVDGFSRRILWLEVNSTNKNIRVIASKLPKCSSTTGRCFKKDALTNLGVEDVTLCKEMYAELHVEHSEGLEELVRLIKPDYSTPSNGREDL